MKRLLVAAFLCIIPLHADWITDLSLVVDSGKLDEAKAVTIVQGYVAQDEKSLQQITSKLGIKDEEGFWATIRGSTYKVQLVAAQGSLRYHKSVLEFIQSLPKNERDEKNLTEQLIKIRDAESELILLKEQFSNTSGFAESIKLGSMIAAKELLIKARRTYLKSTFLL